MNGLINGLYDGLLTGQANGLFDGINNGLHNGLFNNDIVNDFDAQNFINATASLNQLQQNAIKQLVFDLKIFGIWNKCRAIYPFIGGNASTHKFNLKDPKDTNAAFRLTFNGGWTHSEKGALPNGTNGNAETYINDSTTLTLNNVHICIYLRTNTASNTISIWNKQTGATQTALFPRFSNNFYSRMNEGVSGPVVANTDSRGFYLGNRISSTQNRTFINKTLYIQNVNSSGTGNTTFQLAGGSTFFDNRQIAFSSLGSSFTDVEAINFYNLIQKYQNLLNRAI